MSYKYVPNGSSGGSWISVDEVTAEQKRHVQMLATLGQLYLMRERAYQKLDLEKAANISEELHRISSMMTDESFIDHEAAETILKAFGQKDGGQ